MTDNDIMSTYINQQTTANGMRLNRPYNSIKKGDISNVLSEHREYLLSRFNEYYSVGENRIYEAIYRKELSIQLSFKL